LIIVTIIGLIGRFAKRLGRKSKEERIYWRYSRKEKNETRAGQDFVGFASTQHLRLKKGAASSTPYCTTVRMYL
jgi:hypothetical protein